MIALFLFLLGTAMGSFANAVVWRIHNGRNFINERSECEYCHHPLAPHDLIPVLSWVLLRGRCRYCRLRLPMQHPIVEIITGVLFASSFIWWPGGLESRTDVAALSFWLAYLVGIVILFLYDLRWQLLPDKIVFPLIGLAIAEVLIVRVLMGGQGLGAITNSGAGVLVIAGFFGLLYAISQGKWIGFGDVKLGVFMGLILGMPESLFALLSSYYIAAAVILPLFVAGMVKRQSKVAFGPFLLVSFVMTFFLSEVFRNWLSILL